MPNYDYKCQSCGHVFEVFQSMKDAHIKECPECGGRVKRLIGAGSGLIFKGSGFYITDYKKSSVSAGGSADVPASSPETPAKKPEKPAAGKGDSAAEK